MTSRPRILIADDHNLVAELCKRLLESEFDVVESSLMVAPRTLPAN
jgi:CheY-like chemotaxis protein